VAHLKARADVLKVWWQAEKDAIRPLSTLREQIEQTKIESEPAERQDDLNCAAERRYGRGKAPVTDPLHEPW
jgi:ATP-dependent Clp protease ATP-binding subunit ClpB